MLDKDEAVKRAQALRLLRNLKHGTESSVLLWQVAAELLAQLRSWVHQHRLPPAVPRGFMSHVRRVFPLSTPTARVFDLALDIGERYSVSHWDSMILAACVDAGVERFYTEDMGAPRKIATIHLVNPFVP